MKDININIDINYIMWKIIGELLLYKYFLVAFVKNWFLYNT